MTLVMDGYNNDPRELVDIPEVWARRLPCLDMAGVNYLDRPR